MRPVKLRNVKSLAQDLTANNCPGRIWLQVCVQIPVRKIPPFVSGNADGWIGNTRAAGVNCGCGERQWHGFQIGHNISPVMYSTVFQTCGQLLAFSVGGKSMISNLIQVSPKIYVHTVHSAHSFIAHRLSAMLSPHIRSYLCSQHIIYYPLRSYECA